MTMAHEADLSMGSAKSRTGHRRGGAEGRDFFQSLGDAVSQNPVAAGLIGVGALWLFMGGSRTSIFGAISGSEPSTRTSGAPEGLAYAAQTAGEVGRKVGESVSAAASRVSDAISSTYESVSAGTSQAAETASSGLRRTAQQDLAALYERQPLLLGAVGVAIGAGIAAAFPVTEIESRVAGEVSEQVVAKASSLASEGLEKAETVTKKAINELKR